MRICILGKADVPVCNLAGCMVDQGHEVHLVTGLREQEPPPGVVQHHLDVPRKLDFLLASRTVRRMIEHIRPDVVHAFFLTSYGYVASGLPRVPVLATAMGTDVFGAPELSSVAALLRNWLVRGAIRRADHLHSVAPHMTERLIELGADPTKISTFPRGISTRHFGPPQERPGSGACRLVCTRRLEPVYDHATLLRAAALLRERGTGFRLEIVGRGKLRGELESLAAHLGLRSRVAVGDSVSHCEMPSLLQRSDVFVSASRSDGTSSCLLEAMASGCVPVVTDIVANRPWIRDRDNGFLFRPGDPWLLAQAIERSIEARSRWEEIGRANRRFIEEHGSLERGCDRVLEIYRAICGR